MLRKILLIVIIIVVVAGGPLTFSNPLPLGAFVDVVIVGEAEELVDTLLAAIDAEPDRTKLLAHLATLDGFWIPSLHGEHLPLVAKADDALLPARSTVITPNTELRSMFLIEPERGCSRGCTYCVMRRTTNGGMRTVGIAGTSRVTVVDEHGGFAGIGMPRGGHPTDVPPLAGRDQRQQPDGGVFSGVQRPWPPGGGKSSALQHRLRDGEPDRPRAQRRCR